MGRHIDRAQIDRGRISPILIGVYAAENVRQLTTGHTEIHLHGPVIEQPPVLARRRDRDRKGHGAGTLDQIVPRRPIRFQTRLNQRPIGDQAANNKGRARASQEGV